MFLKATKIFLLPICISLLLTVHSLSAQTSVTTVKNAAKASLYLDLQNGMTANEAVDSCAGKQRRNSGSRKETEAAKSLIKQANLRANPKLEANGARQIGGTDSQVMAKEFSRSNLAAGVRRVSKSRKLNLKSANLHWQIRKDYWRRKSA